MELCSAADQLLLNPVQDLDSDSRMAWWSNLGLERTSSTLGLRIETSPALLALACPPMANKRNQSNDGKGKCQIRGHREHREHREPREHREYLEHREHLEPHENREPCGQQ